MLNTARSPFRWSVAMAAILAGAAFAQPQPEATGLRLNQLSSGKGAEALAPKAGGLTERYEIQTTEDHRDFVVKVYRLRNAIATELYRNVLLAVSQEGGTVERILLPTEETGGRQESLLIVTAPEWMIPYLDQSITALDVPGIVDAAWGTEATFIRPRHRRPSELADLIGASVASGVQIFTPDDSRNVLYLEDTPSWWPAVLAGLEAFDQPADMVEAQVRIYEIKESDMKDIGLDWFAWKKTVTGGGFDLTYDNSANTSSYNLDLQSFNAALSFSPVLATEFLNYLSSKGDAEVLTDTTITLINGEAGTVNSTMTIPYVIRNMLDGAPADQPQVDVPRAIDGDGAVKEFVEGVIVDLVPTIGTETLQIAVNASVSSHVGYTPLQSVPIISESSVATVLTLSPDQPGIIGGLSRTTLVEEKTGIPVLKDIPIIYPLFAREVDREQRSQILISIVPRNVMAGQQAPLPQSFKTSPAALDMYRDE